MKNVGRPHDAASETPNSQQLTEEATGPASSTAVIVTKNKISAQILMFVQFCLIYYLRQHDILLY